MTHSEQVNEIAGALAKAQGAIKGAAKDSTNPHFKNRYADLASVWDACRAQLAANGIAVVQAPESDGAKVSVETLLVHSSGQWFRDSLSTLAADARAQSIGSAITYLRRYALAAMVGVAPDDDDGEAAEGRETPKPNGNGSPQSRAETVKARVQQQTQEAMKSPQFRKQEAIKALDSMGLDVRAEVARAVGRTFPAGQDIRLQNEDELAKLEAHVTLRKAEHNQGQAAH